MTSIAPIRTLNDTVPFTYRDSWTFLQKLEWLRLRTDSLGERIDESVEELLRVIDLVNNRIGPHEFTYIDLSNGNSVIEQPLELPSKHLWYVIVSQSPVGGNTVALGEGLSGEVDINPEPNSLTIICFIPNGDGTFTIDNWRSVTSQALSDVIEQVDTMHDDLVDSINQFKDDTRNELNASGYVLPFANGIDDSEAVQTALNTGYMLGFRQFIFPAGIYNLANIQIPGEDVLLRGVSFKGTELRALAGASFIIRTRPHNTLRDMYFWLGNVAATAISVHESSRCTFDNLYIRGTSIDAPGYGIDLTGSASDKSSHANQFSNIMVTNCHTGIWAHSWAYDQEMVNIWVAQCQRNILLNDGGHLLTNIHSWESVGPALWLQSSGGSSRIVNAYLEKSEYGVHDTVSSDYGNMYVACRFWLNRVAGFRKLNGGHVQLSNCVAEDNTGDGFVFYNVNGVLLNGCSAYDTQPVKTQGCGFNFIGGTSNATLVGCVALNTENIIGGVRNKGMSHMEYGCRWSATQPDLVIGEQNKPTFTDMRVYGAASQNKDVAFYAAAVKRWVLRVSPDAGGGLYGGDLILRTVDDVGEYNALTYERANRRFTVADGTVLSPAEGSGMKIGYSATSKLGFFGKEPKTRSAVAVTVEAIHGALVDLGLITS